ncbi:hypothetical protein CNMCM6106_001565 [Aspergillus hiratsukae]|uniref:Amidase domain-containing protein n=1 Tax=Aspergillus hiratsukae TaxID=1194566 RepID=A0A8H6Q1S9_9EURO|nr:hypothetical protein CNMCM6106_001565 [Aspergillus hiratsukae]
MRLLPIALLTLPTVWAKLDFDPLEATISSVHEALFRRTTSCREIVSSFLSRIEAYNADVNALMTLNPDALAIADEMDTALHTGGSMKRQPLFCIPIVLKDNYNTANMNTTGGCLALNGSRPSTDAAAVTALRDAGAIILGKSTLHELALEGLTVSSAGGQTLNPYDQTRTPGGSSGGTGVSVASSFAVFGTGSDTVNSLRSPASANSLFSIRPTRGLISRAGVIPISYTQDVIGPIGRSIEDVATALTVMASVGYDPADNATALVPPAAMGVNYAAGLRRGSLHGVRLGLVTTLMHRTMSEETTPVNDVMDAMVASLTAAGAIVVPVNESIYNSGALSAAFDVQTLEYREALDNYLQDPTLGGVHPTSFDELYQGHEFLVIPSQYSFIDTATVSSTGNASYFLKQQGIRNLTVALASTFKANRLDALIYPEQQNLVVKVGSRSQSGRNGILGALTGSPVVAVPAGFSPPTSQAPIGIPIGMEILGLPWTEPKLLNIAAHIAHLKKVRRTPRLVEEPVSVRHYTSMPTIIPNTHNIAPVYSIGVL